MEQQELKEIIEKHGKWIRGEEGGERADLSLRDLSRKRLDRVDLRMANLEGADLSDASLEGANLEGANLNFAFLKFARLRGANLKGANLKFANFWMADIVSADISGAEIEYACFPLREPIYSTKIDDDQIKLIAYFLVKAGLKSKYVSDCVKNDLLSILDLANSEKSVLLGKRRILHAKKEKR